MTQPANAETVFGAFDGRMLTRSDATHTLRQRGDDFWICDRGRARRARAARRARDRAAPSADLLAGDGQAARARAARVRVAHGRAALHPARGGVPASARRRGGRPRPDAGTRPASPATPRTASPSGTRTASSTPASPSSASPARRATARARARARERRAARSRPASPRRRGRHDRASRGSSITARSPRCAANATAYGSSGTSRGREVERVRLRLSSRRRSERDAGAVPAVAARPRAARRHDHVRACRATPPASSGPDGMARVSGREYNAMSRVALLSARRDVVPVVPRAAPAAGRAAQPREWADDQLAPAWTATTHVPAATTELAANLTEHTHHAAGSSGSRCYNCHMPHTTYGLLKAMRSHQISSPDAGTQRAHRAAQRLQPVPPRPPVAMDGRAAAAALRHRAARAATPRSAARCLGALDARRRRGAARAARRGVSAGAARSAAPGDDAAMLLGVLLDDPYDAVRIVAARSLRRIPGFAGFEYDSTPAPDSRPSASERVFALLEQRRAERAKAGARPELLLGADGAFDRRRLAELLGARDDRPDQPARMTLRAWGAFRLRAGVGSAQRCRISSGRVRSR